MSINVQGFLDALPIIGRGMAGIFVVTILIIAVVALLNRITSNIE